MKFPVIPSLRWRLVAVMCLAYILVAGTTEIAGYNAQRTGLRGELLASARNNAAILAAGSVANLTSRDTTTLQIFVSSLERANGVIYASVIGEGSRVMASTHVREVNTIQKVAFVTQPTSRLSGENAVGIAPVVQSTVLAIAKVVVSGASVQNDLTRLLVIESSVRLLGLLIFFLLSLVISRYILGSLVVLEHASAAIRQGHLSARVALHDGTEMEMVAGAFNDMADALQQRIEHLSFLATAGSALPGAFRGQGDVRPTLEGFRRQVNASGAGLLFGAESEREDIWVADGSDASHAASIRAASKANGAATESLNGFAVMTIPVPGDATFVAVREVDHPFTPEEQQVTINFAYQIGIAADNARLFEAQQEALRVKDQFLSIVSHELRTPLTTIKGYAQMLRRRLADDPEGERFADNIDAQTSRLSRLVDDLLDVTRFSRGQFELMPKRMDLRSLLEEVVSRFRVVSPRHVISLEIEAGAMEGSWDCDRLEQVLNNLLGNAVKYSPEGGEIAVAARRRDREVVVSVRDEGIGISADDRQGLFQRFFRGTSEGQEIKGLGLGLYVTRRIVEAHGGQIDVTSRPGEGSEFFFSLPLLRVRQPSRA